MSSIALPSLCLPMLKNPTESFFKSMVSSMFRQIQSVKASWQAQRPSPNQAQQLIERELVDARAMQRRLLPQNVAFKGVDVAVEFEPHRWVGGDYVEARSLSDGRIFLAVADVCGKGLSSALISASLSTTVRSYLRSNVPLVDLMTGLNDVLCESLPNGSFVTMFAALLDPTTGQLEWVSAGHPPCLIVDQTGDCLHLKAEFNHPLGICAQPIRSHSTTLEKGALLVLYTDGVNELHDEAGEMLGVDRLATLLGRTYVEALDGTLDGYCSQLKQKLDHFRGRALPADDQTLVIVRRV